MRQRLFVERQTKKATADDHAICTDGMAEYWSLKPCPTGP
jgi:hypothetical protein